MAHWNGDEFNVGDSEFEDEDFTEFAVMIAFPRQVKTLFHRRNYFDELRDEQFFDRFRLSKLVVKHILDKFRHEIASPTVRNHAVSAEDKMLITLRYYACGNLLVTCGDFVGIHKSTACRIIRLVTVKLASLRPQYINFPETDDERRVVAQEFYNIRGFPRVIGALDCTHVRIRNPGGHDGEYYRNRKSFFSINVQTISDANRRIQSIVARWPGSTHDSVIFRQSRVRARFHNGEFGDFILLGDAGYPVGRYLMTPVRDPANAGERRYNDAQTQTRKPVECSYGIWKRRFPILALGINVRVTSALSIIIATAVLHNIACFFGEKNPPITAEIEEAIDLTNFPAVPYNQGDVGVYIRRQTASQVERNRLIQYFVARV